MGKKQHYVPQCYLNNFSKENSNQVYVFDKKNHFSRVSNINDVDEANYFYELPNDDLLKQFGLDNKQAIEEFFSKEIETEYAKLLAEIINEVQDCKNPFIYGSKKLLFSRQLALQHIRVNSVRNDLFDSSNCMQQVLTDMGFNKKAEEFRLDKEKVRNIHNCMIFDDENIERTTKAFFDLTWMILVNNSNQKLYTSDNPIVTIGHADMGILSNTGLLCPGIEVVFPITPTIVLLMIDGEYHNCKDKEGQIIQTENSHMISYYNWHQVLNAERSVISCDKNFWLIHDMYFRNPNYIDGPKTVLSFGGKDYFPER